MTWYVAKGKLAILVGVESADSRPITISEDQTFIAEDLCNYVGRLVGTSPRCKLLFGLREVKPNGEPGLWLAPGSRVTCEPGEPPVKLQYLVRFRAPVHRLDPTALRLLIGQVRQYTLQHENDAGTESEAMGLTVLDMYREMKEKKLTASAILNDYKQYTPERIRRKHFHFVKKPVAGELKQMEEKGVSVESAILTYLDTAFRLYPRCFAEEYDAEVEEAGKWSPCVVRVNPFDPEFPGLSYGPNSAKNRTDKWKFACKIDDLMCISLRDVSDEKDSKFRADVARKTGWPINFQFPRKDAAESFVSALHGYYRLTEKWFFNLCQETQSPAMLRLRRDRTHGPIGFNFSMAKLREKKEWEKGAYILRESATEYDTVYLDVCIENGCEPQTWKITKTNNKYRLMGANDDKEFCEIKELLKFYSENSLVPFVCVDVVRPSEYDKCDGLLLCAVVSSNEDKKQANGTLENSSSRSAAPETSSSDAAPLCIQRSQLNFVLSGPGASVQRGRFTNVQKARWFHPVKKDVVDVAVKSMRPEATVDLKAFLNMSDTVLQWKNVTLLSSYGVILADPYALVSEWVPLGPFDAYLRSNRSKLKQVDLTEAATAIVKAMHELHDRNIVHGKIRCRNVLVHAHNERQLQVKLADPGLPIVDRSEIPWIAPECTNTRSLWRSKSADVWAFGTTLWEIFSFGKHPCEDFCGRIEDFTVTQLPLPECGSRLVQKTIQRCWDPDPFARGVPQDLLRHLFTALCIANIVPSARPASTSKSSRKYAEANSVLLSDSSIGTKMTLLDGSDLDHVQDSTALLPQLTSQGTLDIDISLIGVGSDNASFGCEQALSLTTEDVDMSNVQLGQGQYGKVLKGTLATRAGFKQEEVAIKMLKADSVLGQLRDDFKKEIAITKDLRHRNIVEVKGIIDEPLALVLEFVPLGSLVSYEKAEQKNLTEDQLLQFSLDVAEGMEFLSRHKIVHRDLAARNILVAAPDWVKISDFGLARPIPPESDYYMVQNFDRKLPAAWHALENLKGHKFSTRSDVWSFGVTLCEMYSGCLMDISIGTPSEGQNPVEVMIKALENGVRIKCPKPPNVRVSPELVRAVYNNVATQCWLTNPRDRPSFLSLVTVFRDYLARWKETGRIL